MALRAACSGIKIQEYTHRSTSDYGSPHILHRLWARSKFHLFHPSIIVFPLLLLLSIYIFTCSCTSRSTQKLILRHSWMCTTITRNITTMTYHQSLELARLNHSMGRRYHDTTNATSVTRPRHDTTNVASATRDNQGWNSRH